MSNLYEFHFCFTLNVGTLHTMRTFHDVYVVVRRIPRGRVASYGQVAALVGSPRGAQMVGWALRALPPNTDVPWQRVISARGEISIENLQWPKDLQARLLRQEGIEVRAVRDVYAIDLHQYQWNP